MTCPNCNAQNPDNGAFCVGCGQPLAAPQQFPQYAAPAAANDEAKDAQDNKIMGILAYLGILWLVPIFAAKGSQFAKFHANQGLVLFLAEFAYGIVYGILSTILVAISYHLAFISTILGLVYIAFGVFAVLGIISAVKGEKKELPLIGKIKILK